jgi:hypothetical protein
MQQGIIASQCRAAEPDAGELNAQHGRTPARAGVVDPGGDFNLAVIGPHTIWAWNVNEYITSFWNVLPYFLGLAVVLTLLITAPIALIPRAYRFRAVVFVFSISGMAWVQGNWLLENFGLLDEGGLDVAAIADARVRDRLLWFAGIVVAQIVVPMVRRHVVLLAGVFLALQLVSLPMVDPRNGPRSARAPLALDPPDEIFNFSREQNLVLLILDTITSDTFLELADRSPEHFDRAYAGFTFYPDTTGAFPSTQYSLPVMLGAPPYDNTVPVKDYLNQALQSDAITGSLMEHGVAVDWVSAWPLFCRLGRYSSCYAIPRPYGKPEVHHKQMVAELFDISLFRHAPAAAKEWLYAGGAWRAQAWLWRGSEAPVFVASAADFYSDFNASIRADRAEPSFKIVHTGGGHGPFVLDADCVQIPSQAHDSANYERQVRCSLKQTEEFLQRMRELGIYDAATIVVASDHGASFGAEGWGSHGLTPFRLSRARPLLAVKWPGSGGGLTRSPALASLQDIAPTFAAAAGVAAEFSGQNLADLTPDTERSRPYGLYVQRKGTPGGYLERVERYTVARESRRPEAWRFDGAVFSPAIALRANFIDAGTPKSAAHFSYLGWGRRAQRRAAAEAVPAIGPVATVFAALPPAAPVELQARLRGSPWALPQAVTVEANGVPVARWEVEAAEFRQYTATIPASAIGERITAISFKPEKFQHPDEPIPASAFALDWIRFARLGAP